MCVLLILSLIFNHVNVAKIDGTINPMAASYIMRAIKVAENGGAECLIIEMDTPGGLDTAMRQIIKAIMGANIPIVVYVYPPGARAASAGVYITMAAHVAAMAPGTNIGAAHPVAIGMGGEQTLSKEMAEKIENDAIAYMKSLAKKRGRNIKWAEDVVKRSVSATAEEALKLRVIDIVAKDINELLDKMNGMDVEVMGITKTLTTKEQTIKEIPSSARERFFSTISSPTIAYILLMLGLYALFFEFAHPGAIFPGVFGAIALILAFYGLQALPINYAGLGLIILGFILFILEALTPTYGPLAIGGVISTVLGSFMLVRSSARFLQISRPVIITITILIGGFFAFALSKVYLTRKRKVTTGDMGLVGEIAEVREKIDPVGKVFVHGELWNATASVPIKKGEKVRVVAVEGLTLKVEKI